MPEDDSPTPPPRFELTHFQEQLQKIQESDIDCVLVGGHAVSAWAEHFLPRLEALQAFLPFLSKDLDLLLVRDAFGNAMIAFPDLIRFPQRRKPPWIPIIGRATLGEDQGFFEFIDSIKGVNSEDVFKRALTVEFKGVPIKVIDPITLLRAKCSNLRGIEQEDRNDRRHVEMCVWIVQGFIGEALDAVKAGSLTERDIINLLKRLAETVATFQKFCQAQEIALTKSFPVEAIHEAGLTKVVRYLEETLSRQFPNLGH